MTDHMDPSLGGFEDSLDVAIVGMAGRFPKASDINEFWRNLRDAKCSVTFFDEDELAARGVDQRILRDPNYVRAGNPLEHSDLFDAEFFGVSPRDAELMDPQHRIMLECAWTALESAGCDPDRYEGLVGVYAGAGNNTYFLFNVASRDGIIDAVGGNQVMLGNSGDFLATRVSYKLGLEGPSVNVQSACSTSLVAVVLACQALLAYQCDMAIAGGVAIDVLKHNGFLYEPDGLYSPDGYCRSFDAKAQGTVGGNGIGLVVLKRVHDAIVDGDHIHAVIKGMALNNDGARRAGFTAPSAESQALAITTALANADVEPDTVDYVEAHGTATILGDPIEVAALNAAFSTGNAAGKKSYCALGTVKTNIGHLDAAAGVAGLIKTVLSLENAQIPPTLHFAEPNPRIDLENSPFYINTTLLPWPDTGRPRRAGVSSFGLGGTNAHVVLEQAPHRPVTEAPHREQLLVLSARTPAALESVTDRLGDYLGDHPDASLADLAFTLQLGRKAFAHRRVVVAESVEAARAAIDARDDGRLLSGLCPGDGRRPIAFMFTGFGEQFPNMARQLYDQEPVFFGAVDRCAEILRDQVGDDIRTVMFDDTARAEEPGPFDFQGKLTAPEPSDHLLDQPVFGYAAVFAVEYALVELWRSWGVVPDAMIGHSLGEYVAACVAGVFSLEDALRLVVARARLIAQQNDGAMVAVALPEDEVASLVADDLSIAAVNGPATCVLSGSAAAVRRVVDSLTRQGVVTRRLATRHAFHSPLMDRVVEPYADLVRRTTLHPPRIRFVSNVTGTWITPEEATDPHYWARHLRLPVHFADGVATIWAVPDVVLVEVGPGQTLCSLALQHPASRAAADRVVLPSLPDKFGGNTDRAVILRSVGQLWLAGVVIDWGVLHSGRSGRKLPLPTYPFERRRYWLSPSDDPANAGRAIAGRNRLRRGMDDWFYRPSWQRLGSVVPDPAVSLVEQRWLVFVDAGGVGRELAVRLAGLGARVVTVTAGEAWRDDRHRDFVIDPHEPSHYHNLAEILRADNSVPDRVVHCWSVGDDATRPHDRKHVDELLVRAFHSLGHWARAAEPDIIAGSQRWDIVSTEVHRVTGDEPVCPVKATVQGFCKVAQQEYPSLTCAQFDVRLLAGEGLRSVADRLMDELAATVEASAVALRGSYRWGPTFVPASNPRPGPSVLRRRGVYLITGGLGRIGLVVARFLAESVQARLVLIGRTGLPPRADWHDPALPVGTRATIDAVRDLEAMGAEVMVCAADVSDEQQLGAVVDRAGTRFGPVNGVLHAAGTTGAAAHRVIADLGARESAWHFDPKLLGVYALDQALADQEPDFVILCSSVASVLGGLGFSAYAAANAFLDAFAQDKGLRGEPWTSLNWEAWRFPEDGVDGVDDLGIGTAIQDMAISPDEGRAVFALLTTVPRAPQVVVSTGDLADRMRLWANPAVETAMPEHRHARPNLRNPYVAPSNDVEHQVAEIWQELLGLDRVGINDNFFELGGSSLLGLRVVHELRKEMRLAVPLTVVYEGPTVRTLAQLLSELK